MVSLFSLEFIGSALLAWVAFLAIRIIYRLHFHPLAKFPGPKLAAATHLYNAYWDISKAGLIKELPQLHEKHGPIIRTQPDELHCADFEAYNQIFKIGTKFDRVWHDNPFLTGSLQSLATLEETKRRGEFLKPFFSKSAINRVEPLLHRAKITQFLDTLKDATAAGKVVDLFLAFRCLTADTIMDYCFQQDLNALGKKDFQSKTVEAFVAGFDMAVLPSYFPGLFGVINKIIFALPDRVREEIFAPVHGFQTMQKLARERVEYLMANPNATNTKIPTMFDLMLNPDPKKDQVTPSKHDMVAEGSLMIAAGTDTTANVLGTATWHITQNPVVEKKLFAELKRAMPDRDTVLDSATLEGDGFEYMRAVVKESLRLAFGVPGRILRKAPKEGVMLSGQFVPGGTRVTSGQYIHNTHEETFPDPFKFDPERWLCDSEAYRERDKRMVSFSKGSRSCIGINLAYATLHLTVAHMFRRFEIQTTGYTTAEDMEWNDRFVPVPKGKIKGLVRLRED